MRSHRCRACRATGIRNAHNIVATETFWQTRHVFIGESWRRSGAVFGYAVLNAVAALKTHTHTHAHRTYSTAHREHGDVCKSFAVVLSKHCSILCVYRELILLNIVYNTLAVKFIVMSYFLLNFNKISSSKWQDNMQTIGFNICVAMLFI